MEELRRKALELMEHVSSDYYHHNMHDSNMQKCVPYLYFDENVRVLNEEEVVQRRPNKNIQYLIREYNVIYKENTWRLEVYVVYSYDGEVILEEFVEVNKIIPGASLTIIPKFWSCELKKSH